MKSGYMNGGMAPQAKPKMNNMSMPQQASPNMNTMGMVPQPMTPKPKSTPMGYRKGGYVNCGASVPATQGKGK